MSSIYYPARGFFIGKVSKYLVLLAGMAILVYPAAIKADTLAIQTQPNTSTAPASTAPMAKVAQMASLITPLVAVTPTNSKTVWVTAYTSDPAETSDHPLITASGHMVRDGIVAANFLPFGTKIQIPALFGNKVFVVQDRTNQKYSGRVDIWMSNVNKAIVFGIQHAQIVILDSALAVK
jgi:3D (Asp-Asp-Asp) domain-containing protein